MFGKTVEYVLQPSIIDKLALAVTEKFNEGLQKSDTLTLLEKEQQQVQKAIDDFLSAIAVGIVTKSTKEKLLELEQQNRSRKVATNTTARLRKDKSIFDLLFEKARQKRRRKELVFQRVHIPYGFIRRLCLYLLQYFAADADKIQN